MSSNEKLDPTNAEVTKSQIETYSQRKELETSRHVMYHVKNNTAMVKSKIYAMYAHNFLKNRNLPKIETAT